MAVIRGRPSVCGPAGGATVRSGHAILGAVLKWPIRLASVVALSVLAYGWGDFMTDQSPVAAVALTLLSMVLFVALGRLYRPGGLAAFEWDDEEPRRAPGEPAPDRSVRPRRAEPAPAAAGPAGPPPPPATAAARTVSPLWAGSSSGRRPVTAAGAATGEVDLNAAGVAELAPLPGIGRVWAERIVDDRDARGPFAAVDDLARVDGFNPAKLDLLRDRLRT